MNYNILEEIEDIDHQKYKLWIDGSGNYFPEFMATQPDHLDKLQNWKTRDDDILLCTYPKSGTLWLWDIVCLLQSNKTDVQKRIFDTSNLELNSVERLDELPSPRVLQTHMRPKYLPRSFLERRSKIVYGVRNPRDVAVSLHSFMVKINDKWCQYRGSWASFLPLFHEGKVGYGSWFEHINSWEELKSRSEYPVLFVCYEDLHHDCFNEIKRISEFLELDTSDDVIRGIVSSTQFDNFKSEKLKAVGNKFSALSNDGTDPYFRKGIVGDWKNKFTEEQAEIFDQVMHQKKEDSQIIQRYIKKP